MNPLRSVSRSCRIVPLLLLASVFSVSPVSARRAADPVVYTYQGNVFTHFSCGLGPEPGKTCTSPDFPGTSYTETDVLTVTVTVDQPLPANMTFQDDIRALPGFTLTITDGHQMYTTDHNANDDEYGDVSVAGVTTDSAGNISEWDLGVGSSVTGGFMESSRYSNIGSFDTAWLRLESWPTAAGDFAYNVGPSGTWTKSGTPDPTPEGTLRTLIAFIENPANGFPRGMILSLTDKLQNALNSILAGDLTQAINQLGAFINQVEGAVRNGRITPATGAALISAANSIIAQLSAAP